MVALTSRRGIPKELHPDVVQSIEAELAAGRSRRAVAIVHGLDRKVVDRIAAGEHVSQLLGSRYQRCQQGHLAILPCATCAAISERENQRRAAAGQLRNAS